MSLIKQCLAALTPAAIALSLLVASPHAHADAQTLDEAAGFLTEGRLVTAKRTLLELDRSQLSSEQVDRALELMMAIDRRMRYADPNDLSLEKAALALEESNVREAERHAHAVRRADTAKAEQRREATRLLTEAAKLKEAMAPLVEPAMMQAVDAFSKARYAEAKTALDALHRSGVELAPAQLREIDRMRERIMELERSRGRPFQIEPASLGALSAAERSPVVEQAQEEQDQSGAPEQQDEQEESAQPDREQEEDLFDRALRFDAQRILAEADSAFEAGRYNEALQKYRQILGPYSQVIDADAQQKAERRISEINALLELSGPDALEETIRTRELRAEQVRAEFDNLLQLAREALEAGDTEQARTLAEQARLRLSDSRDLFSEQEVQQRLDRQGALVQEIIQTEEQIRQQEALERDLRLQREAEEQQRQRQVERQQRINEALDRVRALQMEQKYQEALQVVEQILFLEPRNPAGLLLKDTLQDVILYRAFDETQRAKNLSYARESNRIQDSMILPDQLLDYPADWPDISFRRGEPAAFAESPEDRRVLAELDSKRIPASFTDNTLEDVVDFIATVTNLNIDVDWDSLQDVGVSRDELVTLELQPLPARVVLDRVLEKVSPDAFSRANWAVNDGVVVIASDEALRKNTFIVIYDVRDLLFQIPSFTEFPTLDLDSVLGQGEGGGEGSIFEDEGEQEGERLDREELRQRLIEIIQTNVDFEGWRDNGGDTGIIQELNDNLIITNTARNHRQISGLLRQLREIRSIQISVEARFLTVNQDFFEQIGFDLDVIFNADNDQFTDALAQQELLQNVITPQVNDGRSSLLPSDISPSFFNPRTTTGRAGSTSDFVATFDDQGEVTDITLGAPRFVATRPDGFSQLPTNQNSNNIVSSLINSPFAEEVLSFNPALQFAGTYLDDIQVDFLVEATQADRRNVNLTAPRLTFTNGNAANIFVTTQQAFVSDLNPIVGTNSVAFDPTVDVVSTGFTLGLEGVVSADRRYVTLTIRTSQAEVIDFADAEVTAQTGGGTEAGAPSPQVTSAFQLPVVEVTSISTGATIPDRGTLLLGGQRISNEVEVESGVPVLSKLPVINRFFTNRIESKQEATLIILVKPTIIIQSEEEEKNFPGLLDSLENRFNTDF